MMEVQSWTTPGVGDFMFILNRVHNKARILRTKAKLEFNWYHDKEYLHHFEEEETIIDRVEYIHKFYANSDSVKLKHVFNSQDMDLINDKLRPSVKDERYWSERAPYDNMYPFRPIKALTNPNKVVIWRPKFNAETPRLWKRLITNDVWDEVIDILEGHGYTVVELTYRTPVREVMYEVSTCNFVVCYDGMWHYIAKNLGKPMIVTSRSLITHYHTPHALMYAEKRNPKRDPTFVTHLKTRLQYLHNYGPGEDLTTYQQMCKRAEDYKSFMELWYNAHRQSGY